MSELHARLLQFAALKLGGTEELARYLQVPEVRLRVWQGGRIAPPDDIFLKLVDLLQEPPPQAPRPDRRSRPEES
jgi:hypothetical protein